jgi:hypothetical protein
LNTIVHHDPDAIYDRFENGGTGTAKLDLSKSELEGFISKAIVQTLGVSKTKQLGKTTDLFAFGVDSLQATRIRNICQKELELNGKTLGQNGKPFYLYYYAYMVDQPCIPNSRL